MCQDTLNWDRNVNNCLVNREKCHFCKQSHKEEFQNISTPPLEGLGLSLSGCEREETNAALVSSIVKSYPGLSNHYKVGQNKKPFSNYEET